MSRIYTANQMYSAAKKLYPFYGLTADKIDAEALGMKKVGFHIHTTRSWSTLDLPGKNLWGGLAGMRYPECSIEIEDLLLEAERLGYSELVITNHADPVGDGYSTKNKKSPLEVALEAAETAKQSGSGIDVTAGVEFLLRPGNIECGYHVLLIGLKEELPEEFITATLRELSEECRKQGALVCLPHPLADDNMHIGGTTLFYNSKLNAFNMDIAKYIDGISVINSLQFAELNRALLLAGPSMNVALLGESDSHTIDSLVRAGTLIPKNHDFVTAVREKSTIPFGIDGKEEFAKALVRNSYKLTLKYADLLRTDPDGNHGKGFEYFKEVHCPKNKAHIKVFETVLRLATTFITPIIEEVVYEQRENAARTFQADVLYNKTIQEKIEEVLGRATNDVDTASSNSSRAARSIAPGIANGRIES